LRRLHIPLHLLRAFIATARHSSMSRAAEELSLTQSAVSKQVVELERLLGHAMFERVRKRLVLSPVGQRYLARVQPLLQALDAATLDVLAQGDGGGALHLSTFPTFAAKWLIPRLQDFRRSHPDVTLHFVPYAQGYDFTLPELDCAIRYGEGTWPGSIAQYLIGREMVVIAPPASLDARPLRRPEDIRDHDLLQHATVPGAWAEWCEAHGVAGINPMGGQVMEQYSTVIQAVSVGLGLALVPRCLVDDDLARGIVRAPLEGRRSRPFKTQAGYYLCYPEAKAHLPALAAFRDWITACCGSG
jgi:LysR family glycine cleavage system transcriptional activator